MKKTLPILTVIFTAFFLVGCANTSNKTISNKFSFDIDVSNLSYTLPSHTKLCTPDRKQECSSEGCEDIQPTVFLAYDEPNNMIYRCDNKPCDGYEVQTSQSGLYTNIAPIEPRGFTVKVSSDNEYVETVNLGLNTLVSYGTCR